MACRFFPELQQRIRLRLLGTQTFGSGVVALRYAVTTTTADGPDHGPLRPFGTVGSASFGTRGRDSRGLGFASPSVEGVVPRSSSSVPVERVVRRIMGAGQLLRPKGHRMRGPGEEGRTMSASRSRLLPPFDRRAASVGHPRNSTIVVVGVLAATLRASAPPSVRHPRRWSRTSTWCSQAPPCRR